jgi:hypothetical protein
MSKIISDYSAASKTVGGTLAGEITKEKTADLLKAAVIAGQLPEWTRVDAYVDSLYGSGSAGSSLDDPMHSGAGQATAPGLGSRAYQSVQNMVRKVTGKTKEAAAGDAPPAPGARKGTDGKWYVKDDDGEWAVWK